MAFRFKDLMVEVVGAGDRANLTCPTLSVDPANLTCPTLSIPAAQAAAGGTTGVCPTLSFTPVYAAMIATPGTICGTLTMPAAAQGTQNLTALKQQLQQALQQVEAQERAAAGPGLPATAEEADDLDRRLREALEELQEHKKTLQKPAQPGTKKATKGRK
ncbi:MAG TPA: hypothetical protein VNM67_09635 [Thermoanaerobaculia bacterium]|jgi:hypothetical protein|nr:hypothetical protein [Thermoanaerobaculia bacterium]